MQEDNEQRYAVDTFWLENIQFKKKIDTLAFANLFEVRETANSLYSLALEYSLGDKVKNEFIEKIKFVNYLLENLGHGEHEIALQRLKDKFGGRKGMSSKNKKEADRIIRESLRGNNMQMYSRPQQFQQFGPMPPMNVRAFPYGAYGTFSTSSLPSCTSAAYEGCQWTMLHLPTAWACSKELSKCSI